MVRNCRVESTILSQNGIEPLHLLKAMASCKLVFNMILPHYLRIHLRQAFFVP